MKHKVKITKWVNGVLKNESHEVDSLEDAKKEIKKHHGNKGHCKIYDENDFLIFIEKLIEEIFCDSDDESYA